MVSGWHLMHRGIEENGFKSGFRIVLHPSLFSLSLSTPPINECLNSAVSCQTPNHHSKRTEPDDTVKAVVCLRRRSIWWILQRQRRRNNEIELHVLQCGPWSGLSTVVDRAVFPGTTGRVYRVRSRRTSICALKGVVIITVRNCNAWSQLRSERLSKEIVSDADEMN